MHLISPQAERGALSHVQDFSCLEQRDEQRQVAFIGDAAYEAAHIDFLFLSGRISLPVVPPEVLIFYGIIFSLVDETVEIPSDVYIWMSFSSVETAWQEAVADEFIFFCQTVFNFSGLQDPFFGSSCNYAQMNNMWNPGKYDVTV